MRVGLERLVDGESVPYVEESRAFYAARAASRGADFQPDPSTPEGLQETRALEEARAMRTVSAMSTSTPVVEALAEVAGRRVPVRIFTPEGGAARGVYLDIHGGGFYMGLAARGDAHNRDLAHSLGIAVVSVEYRLAPEHPWPAAPDDCETAALWLLEQAENRFGTTRLAIGGVSAGATLAMTTLLRLRDRGAAHRFVGAALQFGAYDMSGKTPAGRLLNGEFFIQAYAGHVADRTTPDLSPVYGELRGLPPILLVVGSLDILLEDNLVMAARLSAAGGEVDVRVYPESPHGFTLHPTTMARTALDGIQSWIADRFLDAAAREPEHAQRDLLGHPRRPPEAPLVARSTEEAAAHARQCGSGHEVLAVVDRGTDPWCLVVDAVYVERRAAGVEVGVGPVRHPVGAHAPGEVLHAVHRLLRVGRGRPAAGWE